MDNARLVAVLGREPHTPLDAAVEASLRGLGCRTKGEWAVAGHNAPGRTPGSAS